MRSDRTRHLWALVPALCVPFAAALFYFVICTHPPTARIVYAGAKVFLAAWPLLASRFLLKGRPDRWNPAAGNRRKAAAIGLLTGAAMSGLIVVLMLTPLGKAVAANAGSIRERSEHLGILRHYWAFAVFLSLAHSLLEEYYWRWFVYGTLRRLVSPLAAAAISAVAFGSHHVIVTGQLINWPLGLLCGTGIAAGGFIWALLYNRYRSLTAPWISHVVVDFVVMAIGYILITA
jgi:membrane protease YdiL (CAAX protease family)